MTARRPATLIQVAQRAGVSLTTASKAINQRDRIAEHTRQRVMAAARELSYTPNENARSLITGRTSTVGLIMIDSRTARFAVPVMLGAEDALGQIDLTLITSDARGDDDRLRELAAMLQRRNVDGLIVVGDDNRRTPSMPPEVTVPVVYVYGEPDSPSGTACLTDNEQGGFLVAEHLLDLGRRRIAHITGPRRATSVVRRVAGVRRALSAQGLRPVGGVRYGPWSRRWGRLAVERLMAEHADIDAVICGSDQIAAGVVDSLIGSGRQVPAEIAVTGYDDWEPFALDSEPQLTSVSMNLEELGRTAARELFNAIDGRSPDPSSHTLPPSLIVRASSVSLSTAAEGVMRERSALG